MLPCYEASNACTSRRLVVYCCLLNDVRGRWKWCLVNNRKRCVLRRHDDAIGHFARCDVWHGRRVTADLATYKSLRAVLPVHDRTGKTLCVHICVTLLYVPDIVSRTISKMLTKGQETKARAGPRNTLNWTQASFVAHSPCTRHPIQNSWLWASDRPCSRHDSLRAHDVVRLPLLLPSNRLAHTSLSTIHALLRLNRAAAPAAGSE